MKITVIGAGNGGQAIAGYCAWLGYDVCLYDIVLDHLAPVVESHKIHLKGQLDITGKIDIVTDDIKTAVEYSKLIFIVTTANAHAPLAQNMAPYLTSEHTILLNPGRTFGALQFSSTLAKFRPDINPDIAEAQTLVYACRVVEPGVVNIIGIKDKVLLAGRSSEESDRVIAKVSGIYPCFVKSRDLIHTGLLNVGAIFHPSIVMFNAATIERQDKFYFYRQMTPKIGACIEKLDAERIAVGRAYGIELMPVSDWILYAYPGTKGDTLAERMRNNAAYHDILAPGSIFTRQLTEDIPTGLLPMSELGKVAGVKTPIMDSFINLSSALLDIDFTEKGRTLKNLGLDGLSVEQIIEKLA